MQTINTAIRIEREIRNGLYYLLATYNDGTKTYFGRDMTERGSKRMLTVRAKQFGLTVTGDIAA